MYKLGLYSFRRILLSRLLLLSVPVLLLGVYVTYRKARSSLLDTAGQNLTESAIARGKSIHQSVQALRSNLITASNSVVFQTGSPQEYQEFVNQLNQGLPTLIDCVQLVKFSSPKEIKASTCGDSAIEEFETNLWSKDTKKVNLEPEQVYVKHIVNQGGESKDSTAQLQLLMGAPVYDLGGNLRYLLYIKTSLIQQEKTPPGSLSGYPVIIDENETILVHPFAERVGSKIDSETDADRLRSVIRNARAGNTNSLYLFALEKNGVDLLAGYSSIPSPISDQTDNQWVILAVTRVDNALSELKSIRRALLGMTLALMLASLLATLYISRELAQPLEKLRDYALNEDNIHSTGKLPQNLDIREFNQLAAALNSMVERLKTWAEELETAWKEAQVANQLKNEFLATISHELRTPLNGIIGCIQLIRDGYYDSEEEKLELLDYGRKAALHLLEIINDILDLAKIEQGKLSLNIEQVNLCHVLDEVISLQAVTMQEKGLELITNPCNHQDIMVNADPLKFKQVLLNIVGNAVKFTDTGSITITTQTKPFEDVPLVNNNKTPELEEVIQLPWFERQRVVITVQDTGIGVDPSQQHKLFRPFVMVDGSTTRKFGGTGLGLAISRNLMELMGGDINLHSAGKGKGTKVEISIPAVKIG